MRVKEIWKENMDNKNVIVEEPQKTSSEFIFFDDECTRNTVSNQYKIHRFVKISILLSFFIITIYNILVEISKQGYVERIINGAFYVVIMFVISAFVFSAVDSIFLNSMRSIRFRKCVARMSEWANKSITVTRSNFWKTPYPKFLAIDPVRKLLAIEAEATNYVGSILRADQILDVKVEREQHVETRTTHSGRTIYGGVFGGIFGAGRVGRETSKSTSRTVEQAYLEITFALSSTDAPCRVVFEFGKDRRQADDWVLMIDQMRR